MIPATVTLKGIWAALIAAAFAIVLGLLAVQTARIEGFKVWPLHWKGWIERATDAEAAAKQCDDNLTASNASIDRLQASLGKLMEQARTRAAEYDAAKRQAEVDKARNDERAKGSDALIAQLRARAAQGGQCKTPADLAKMAEGL